MKNNYVNTVKGFITAVTGCLSSILGVLYIPVLLLISSNLIGYITGLMVASQKDIKGKMVCHLPQNT